MMMKRNIASAALLALALTASAQAPATVYIKVDLEVVKEIVDKHVAKAKPVDTKEEYLYKGLLEDALNDYLQSKKVRANVVEQSVLSQMKSEYEERLREKDAEIKNLSKENYENKLQGAQQDFNSRLAAKDAEHQAALTAGQLALDSLKGVVNDRDQQLRGMDKEVADRDAMISRLQAENDQLKKNDALFKNISAKLNQKREALDDAYRSCANTRLGGVKDFAALRQTGVAYTEFLDILGQTPSADEKKQIADIDALCKAADYYQRAVAQLAKKYDAKANEALIAEYTKSRPVAISPMQKTELSQAYEALKEENMVVAAFRNSILGYLRSEGCIPDRTAMTAALGKIDEEVKKFSEGDPNARGGYNVLYVEVNKSLDNLRNGVKGFQKNGYDDPDKFGRFLDTIDASLGGK